ncbi:homoserine kinase [Winogradskyella maritima]|uniref:Homoserine kinase n=1 Tax=Winogradskyella maritima TaxID=1517766 RepID=A0ABV8AD75_9FLAO|nr:homoserine kinase [Winogradskyella maritima]
MTNEIKLFTPATVANVACGFDVLGFCLDTIGDEMTVRKVDKKGIFITKSEGFNLPTETEKNVAGVSALAMYEALQPDCGFEIEIKKNIKPGSGIGSSSASAVGSIFGMNQLLGQPLNCEELIAYALKGEALASGAEHADNLAPVLYGGFTLVKSCNPVKILELPTPEDLFAVIIHPQIEVKTSEARNILPDKVPLKDAITQWCNIGSLVHALHTADYDLLSNSLTDVIVEPHRKALIPYFDDLKANALQNGALGCGISGSGPSVFALTKGKATAKKVSEAFDKVYSDSGINYHIYVSPINTQGIKIL